MTALNFPANPYDGQVYQSYKYSLALDTWEYAPSSISYFSDVVIPNEPQNGSVLSYNFGSSSWVANYGAILPVGSIMPFAGTIPPDGYLLCDGSTTLRELYPDLFEVIGVKYETGSELSTEFRLPNVSGRVLVGADTAQPEFDKIGKTGGSKTHTLTIDEMPNHTHTQVAHTHTQDQHNHTQDSHSHGISIWWNPNDWENGSFGLGYFGSWGNVLAVTGGWGFGVDYRTPYIQNTTATNNDATATNQNAGSGSSHNNLQPYTVINYIIKHSHGGI